MVQYYWFFAAITASIMWGIGYVLSEVLLKNDGITPIFIATFTSLITLPVFLGLAFYYKDLKEGLSALAASPNLITILILEAFTIIGGTFLIYTAISMKNASLVSIIESIYPVFAIIFAYMFLKEVQINIWGAAGFLLIITGIALIILKNN